MWNVLANMPTDLSPRDSHRELRMAAAKLNTLLFFEETTEKILTRRGLYKATKKRGAPLTKYEATNVCLFAIEHLEDLEDESMIVLLHYLTKASFKGPIRKDIMALYVAHML